MAYGDFFNLLQMYFSMKPHFCRNGRSVFSPLASLSFGRLISFYSRRCRAEHGLRLREEKRRGGRGEERAIVVGRSVVCVRRKEGGRPGNGIPR